MKRSELSSIKKSPPWKRRLPQPRQELRLSRMMEQKSRTIRKE